MAVNKFVGEQAIKQVVQKTKTELLKKVNTDQLELKANVASPILTGTPQAPTPVVGTVSNQIATCGFVHSALSAVAAAKTYTVCINLNDTNPLTCITYHDDAVLMTKGDSSWDNAAIFKDIRPCMFKSGSVAYYLQKGDFTKKEDGSAADLTGADGDVMIEFPKFAYYIEKVSAASKNELWVSITNNPNLVAADSRYKYYAFTKKTLGDRDHFYMGAYKAYGDTDGKLRSIPFVKPIASKTLAAYKDMAKKQGDGYTINSYFQLLAVQCLFIIRYGSLNGQDVLGPGITGRSGTASDPNYGTINTGGTETFGMCYKSVNNGSSTDPDVNKLGHVKFMGIEDFWGNIWEWIDGFTTHNYTIVTSYDYDNFVAGKYSDPAFKPNPKFEVVSGLSADSSGYVTEVSGTTESGFMGIKHGGSATQRWCDYGSFYGADRILDFGGSWDSGAYPGPFLLSATNVATNATANVGSRLLYI